MLRYTIPTLVLLDHVLEFLLGYEVQLELPAELALVIPPELARAISLELTPSLVLAHLLASPDLVCALYGGHPPCPCSLVLYYHGCPTEFPLALKLFAKEVGVPEHLIADPACAQKSREVVDFCLKIGNTLCLLEESTQ